MHEFYAARFLKAWVTIGQIEVFCSHGAEAKETHIPDVGKADLVARLADLEKQCSLISLDIAASQIRRIKTRVERRPVTYSKLSPILESLRDSMGDELAQSCFLFVPGHAAHYYREEPAFGIEVAEKWCPSGQARS